MAPFEGFRAWESIRSESDPDYRIEAIGEVCDGFDENGGLAPFIHEQERGSGPPMPGPLSIEPRRLEFRLTKRAGLLAPLQDPRIV
jgi:hypothetical protein